MSYQEEQDFTNERVDPKLWKRLYAYAWRNKKTFIMTIVCLLYVALADSLYPLLTNYAVDRFIIPGKSDGTWLFLLIYIALAFSQGFGTLGFITRCGRMEMNISYDIRQDGFLKLQNQSFSYFDKTAVGYLMARMVSDVSRLSEMVAWSMVDLLWSSCYALLCLIIMLIAFFMERAILKYQREARKHNSRITGAFNEGIMGAMTTKTLVYEEENAREFREITQSMRKASIKAALINAVFFPLVISLGAVGTSLALYLGGKGVLDPGHAFIGEISAGTLVAFITYAASLFDPIQQFASIFADFQSAQASAERVVGLIDAPIQVQDAPEVVEKYGDVIHPKRENWEPILGHIRFEHVNFAYNPEEPVLTDFNLDIQAGQTIALVGETGAGKSTIVNLICRFYEPTAGAIYIDGKDYRTRSQLWLQSSLGYVLQSPHLFSGTIADNIRYGRPDATLEEVKEAARLVHAENFILEQAKGYDTEVGEGGIRLSTGQKQLICFARVILADPRIFVLDEATSSIDTETEQLIQEAITTVLKGRTSLVVAHRLSTIRNADRILVIRGGKIQESGTHEELIALGGYYHDLYEHQFREERLHSAMKDAGME